MAIAAVFHDGVVARPHQVVATIEGEAPDGHVILSEVVPDPFVEDGPGSTRELARWRLGDIEPVPAQRDQLRLRSRRGADGARLVFTNRYTSDEARRRLPVLRQHKKRERGRQARLVGLATAALASVIVAYIYGVPLMAGRIVDLIPPEAEERFGEAVVEQVAVALKEQGGLEPCDPDPDSVANRAISRFATEVANAEETPFTIDVQVVDNSIPNAFALPGGRSFYFSGLLEQTETPDEFAGIVAHEIGHIVHRHGMESLVATAGTGLLVGFVLGDVTGISIAAGIGATLIDTSFSREAEREADAFAATVAKRMNFDPAAIVDVLERIAGNEDDSPAMALFSTHPMTAERRQNLETVDPGGPADPVFTRTEWKSIKTMCATRFRSGVG